MILIINTNNEIGKHSTIKAHSVFFAYHLQQKWFTQGKSSFRDIRCMVHNTLLVFQMTGFCFCNCTIVSVAEIVWDNILSYGTSYTDNFIKDVFFFKETQLTSIKKCIMCLISLKTQNSKTLNSGFKWLFQWLHSIYCFIHLSAEREREALENSGSRYQWPPLLHFFKSPQSGVTLCFQFVSAAASASSAAAAMTFASRVKTVWARP